MTTLQRIMIIALCALATIITRFLPFLVFREGRPVPRAVEYLGKYLPPAVFGMLVVYCLRNTDLLSAPHGLPEALALGLTVLIHLWKRKTLLSIAAGTVCYMLMLRVF